MALWLAQYWPGARGERPRFRVVAADETDRWIAETNPDLPPEVQEEAALLIADALSRILGV